MTAPTARPKWSALRKFGVIFLLPVAVGVVVDLISAGLRGEPPWALSLLWDVAVAGGKTLLVPWATPAWVLVLLASGTVLAVLDSVRARRTRRPPSFHAYTRDLILGVRWTWRWDGNRVVGLTARCPIDGMPLVFGPTGYAAAMRTTGRCEKCTGRWEFEYRNQAEIDQAAAREINRKVHTEEWRSVPTS